jgi:predicted DNA-binding transcriptional regulator AlpA
MSVVSFPFREQSPDRLLSPREALEYLQTRYGIIFKISTFYSMINRGEAPKVTYFRKRSRFLAADIDEWVRGNLSDKRTKGSVQ